MPAPDTICAIATARGDAAIGIVRLSGPLAADLLLLVCGKRALEPRRLHLVQVRDPRNAELLDQALVCLLPGPHTFSGEDMAEVQAHGGQLNLQRLLRLFLELGARLAAPGEFTRRAFLAGRLDLSRAEAVAEVIRARSDRELQNAQALLAGGLLAKLAPLRQQLLEMAAVVEASIDFAEEVAAPAGRQTLLGQSRELGAELRKLAGSYVTGRRLQGARLGLVGVVNAGKSTLFNRLLGRQRAIVSEEPGTTRDYLEGEVSWDGYRVQLIDGAGWRPVGERSAAELAGAALVEVALQSCDLLLEVLDLGAAALGTTAERAGVPVLRVGNKVDLVEVEKRHRLEGRADMVLVSALSGEGVEELRRTLVKKLFAGSSEESLFVTEERQWQALQRASQAVLEAELGLQADLGAELIAEHLREALRRIGEISGEGYTEAVLDEVFGRFCVGK